MLQLVGVILKIQNRDITYFVGVHKNALILGLQSEMGWLNVKFKIISIYPTILESPYDNEIFTFNKIFKFKNF